MLGWDAEVDFAEPDGQLEAGGGEASFLRTDLEDISGGHLDSKSNVSTEH